MNQHIVAKTVLEMSRQSAMIPTGALIAKLTNAGVEIAQNARWIVPAADQPGWFQVNPQRQIVEQMREIAEKPVAEAEENKQIGDTVLFVDRNGKTIQATVAEVTPNGQLVLADDKGQRLTVAAAQTRLQAKVQKPQAPPAQAGTPTTAPQSTTPVAEAASPDLVRQILRVPSGGRATISLKAAGKAAVFIVYYDEQPAVGDGGGAVQGMISGAYEVFTPVVGRTHSRRAGGEDAMLHRLVGRVQRVAHLTQRYWAAEQCAKKMLDYLARYGEPPPADEPADAIDDTVWDGSAADAVEARANLGEARKPAKPSKRSKKKAEVQRRVWTMPVIPS